MPKAFTCEAEIHERFDEILYFSQNFSTRLQETKEYPDSLLFGLGRFLITPLINPILEARTIRQTRDIVNQKLDETLDYGLKNYCLLAHDDQDYIIFHRALFHFRDCLITPPLDYQTIDTAFHICNFIGTYSRRQQFYPFFDQKSQDIILEINETIAQNPNLNNNSHIKNLLVNLNKQNLDSQTNSINTNDSSRTPSPSWSNSDFEKESPEIKSAEFVAKGSYSPIAPDQEFTEGRALQKPQAKRFNSNDLQHQ